MVMVDLGLLDVLLVVLEDVLTLDLAFVFGIGSCLPVFYFDDT